MMDEPTFPRPDGPGWYWDGSGWQRARLPSGEWIQPMSDETRVTDPDTGGQKGQKLERYDLIPTRPLAHLARHYGVGASKYEDRNWEKGYKWSLSYAALLRHLVAFWGGEDIDPENGQPHLAAVLFHAMALMEFGETHPEKDDRPNAPQALLKRVLAAEDEERRRRFDERPA